MLFVIFLYFFALRYQRKQLKTSPAAARGPPSTSSRIIEYRREIST